MPPGVECPMRGPGFGKVHMDSQGEERRRTLEGFLRQLRDIIAVRVELQDEEHVAAIRVLARAGRNPRQIVRDVQSALLSRFNTEVGADTISVAQLSDEAEEELSPSRFVLRRVSRSVAGTSGTVNVEMSLGEQVVEGTATGAVVPPVQARVAAQAALVAVHKLLGVELLYLVDAKLAETAGVRVAVVVLGLAGEERGTYVGCARVRLDEAEAVARATLSALNRHLVWYRQG